MGVNVVLQLPRNLSCVHGGTIPFSPYSRILITELDLEKDPCHWFATLASSWFPSKSQEKCQVERTCTRSVRSRRAFTRGTTFIRIRRHLSSARQYYTQKGIGSPPHWYNDRPTTAYNLSTLVSRIAQRLALSTHP